MKIAQIAPLWIEVPPQSYGGVEYIVSLLTDELIRRGHDVTLFATANSKTNAKLVPIWPKGLFYSPAINDPFSVFGLMYKEFFARQEEFDIIHDHCDFYFTPVSDFVSRPVVSTLHNTITEEKYILFKKNPKVNYVAISHDQKKLGPGINIVKTIYHGIPFKKYEFNNNPEGYLLWLSNITPDKGLTEAIEIAKMAGENLIISGPIFSQHADFFEYRIKPLIDGKQIQFVGEANFEKKVQLLKNAKAFLFPIFKRQEPFGLVVIEALACGTPVITANSGAMPELVQNGKTGFIINSNEEAVEAIKKIDSISRLECRRHVIKRFSVRRMVNNYERLYKNILDSKN
jgi:glycosyltransferase involved in cell wall biosynthesis